MMQNLPFLKPAGGLKHPVSGRPAEIWCLPPLAQTVRAAGFVDGSWGSARASKTCIEKAAGH
jgi:hypothetical protein